MERTTSKSPPTRSTREHGRNRGVPWATFALIALCGCVYSLVAYSARQVQLSTDTQLRAAGEYLIGHPYLEPDPVLAERVDPNLLAQQRASGERARERRGAPALPRRIREEQQQRLDELVRVALASAASLPAQRWGFRANQRSPASLLTHVFLHESGMHLLGGMVLILILGFQLEVRWGAGVFLGFVGAASAASAVAFGIGNPEAAAPLIGMSGVVAALLGAFLIRFRSTWKQPIFGFATVSGALFLVFPLLLGHEWSLAAGIASGGAAAAVGGTLWAAAGGFAFGLIGQGLISVFFESAGDSRRAPGAGSARAGNPQLEKVVRAHAAGRFNEAYGTLVEFLREHPDDCDALLVMWKVGLDHGHSTEAASAMLRVVRAEVQNDDAAAAVEHWLELAESGLQADAQPALLIRLALMLQKHGHSGAAVAALRQALQKSCEADAAVVAARVARASRDLDAATARSAAWRALGSVDLDLEERQNLESLLAEIGSGIDTSTLAASASAVGKVAETKADESVRRAAPEIAAAEAADREVWVDPSLVDDADAAGASVDPGSPMDAHPESPSAVAPPAGAHYPQPEPIALDLAARSLRSIAATPIALEPDGLRIEAAGGKKKRLALEKLDAISVAAVAGLGDKPVLLIDLVMNWTGDAEEPLKVIRMRSDRFDARALVRDAAASPLDALRAFVSTLLGASGAMALPDEPSAKGMPFASFESLAAYERAILGVFEPDRADTV